MIALDLDGTLLTSKKEITPRTREALRRARQRGIVTVIATGRTPHSALRFSREIGGGPVICCNGAGVLDAAGEFLAQRTIPRAPLQRLLEMGRQANLFLECYTPQGIVLDQPLRQALAYLRWVRPGMGWATALASLERIWRTNRIRAVRSLSKWADQPQAPSVLKVMVVGEPAQLAPWAREVEAAMPGLNVSSSGADNLEITAAGVSKGSGLAQLGARLQIPRDAMIALGDSANDLEMLTYVGMGVAMGNATDPIKAAARRVTATCDDEGVARTIEELCL